MFKLDKSEFSKDRKKLKEIILIEKNDDKLQSRCSFDFSREDLLSSDAKMINKIKNYKVPSLKQS